MATYLDLIDNLEKLDVVSIADMITERNAEFIIKGVQNQLWNGQKPDGSAITPSYLNDPYFKTRKQAEAYASWKFSGGYKVNTTRDKYTPNLYINGYFYKGIDVKLNKGRFDVVAHWGEVASKYNDALGLNQSHAESIIENHVRPSWEIIVESRTGLKFN